MLTDIEIELIRHARHGDPFAVLGPHAGADGRVQLRTAPGALLALPAGSEVRLGAQPTTLTLAAGGLRLSTANAEWRVD
ncbi:hypothetical protein, partial [Piscinibacter sp.]|uniref:hypothetical protein n=1 Tax=Piscinibacter sp. TaxID=1903157 RepID=UPI003784B830